MNSIKKIRFFIKKSLLFNDYVTFKRKFSTGFMVLKILLTSNIKGNNILTT